MLFVGLIKKLAKLLTRSLAAVLDSKLFLKTVFSRELPKYAATLVKMQIHRLSDMSPELESPRLLPF